MVEDLVARNLGNWFRFDWYPAPKSAVPARAPASAASA